MRFQHISKNLLVLTLLFPLLFSGCVYLIVGGIGAVGGYIVSPDTVEGTTEMDAATTWSAAVEVVSVMGLIDEENEEGGMILATINGTKVTIILVSISQTATKVTVKARKAYLPRISLAQDVFVKIMSHFGDE